ncbi:helix-turn-helix transcriptional regulator [Flammeovirga sp. MY04]|uniref:helix-turn-helix domain-containing protein n=1 Tax=Flammeovirga sp. MY04 TaxID=1191459 RepID=UPI0008061726|nr:AraC family transcriptional regulator [Flammeovirga sp. MY04]ANQ49522.1 helix-turn-helix transcriptional regulator [Flammeovirga sp. MY04]
MNIPRLEFKEGNILQLMDQLIDNFGGERKQGTYNLNHELLKAEIRYIELGKGVEITLNSIKFSEDYNVLFNGNNQKDRHLCYRFSLSGDFVNGFPFDENKVSKSEGMAIFDTAMTFETIMRKDQWHQWLGIRISKGIIENNFAHFLDYFGDVFNKEKTWMIYDHTPLEVNLLLKELFDLKHQKKLLPVENAFIIAKSSEIIGIFYERILSRKVLQNKYVHEEDLKALFKIKDDILSTFEMPPSLEEIAEKYGFSVSKLRRDFQKVFGTSIHKFHQNYRLEEAKIALAAKNRTVTEISRTFGYKSIAKFSYAFKKKFGIAPSEFILK